LAEEVLLVGFVLFLVVAFLVSTRLFVSSFARIGRIVRRMLMQGYLLTPLAGVLRDLDTLFEGISEKAINAKSF